MRPSLVKQCGASESNGFCRFEYASKVRSTARANPEYIMDDTDSDTLGDKGKPSLCASHPPQATHSLKSAVCVACQSSTATSSTAPHDVCSQCTPFCEVIQILSEITIVVDLPALCQEETDLSRRVEQGIDMEQVCDVMRPLRALRQHPSRRRKDPRHEPGFL